MPQAVYWHHIVGASDHCEGAVNLDDFTVLAANFGQAGRVFSQGNFDYSAGGAVSLDDFTILAAQFGKTLPAAGEIPARLGTEVAPKPAVMAAEFLATRAISEGRFAGTRLIDELAGGDDKLPS